MSDTDSLYLQKLKFDPKLHKSFMAFLIRKVRVVMLAILTLIAAGVFAFVTLPRELNPEVNIPLVNIVTTLPGASPADVERLITTEIENSVANIQGIDALTSNSTNSLSVVTIQFLSTVDSDKVLQEVKDEVGPIVSDLPDDASDPTIELLDFNEQPVLTVALIGDINRISLTNISKDLEDRLESETGISRVDISGSEEEEIVIQLDPEALSTYNLSPNTISQTIGANNISFPAGTIQVGDTEYSLTVNNEFSNAQDVRNQLISIGNQTITLGEIADVYYRSKPNGNQAFARLDQDTRVPAVQLSVFKTETATISDAANTARDILDAELDQHPEISYVEVIDVAQSIEQQFAELASNFGSTILLVFVILFLFLGLRQATVASISIPLTFLSAFTIMSIFGVTLNFLSLFSLLLALGLVVDDAIVIVQAANQYGKKFKPDEAALLVFRDFVVPIWTTTLTTVWAFLPLVLASGIIGAFIRSIPVVVSATLISSTSIAVLLNIPLTVIFARLNNLPRRVRFLLASLTLITLIVLVANTLGGSPITPMAVIAFIILTIVSWFARKQIIDTSLSTHKQATRSSRWYKRISRFISNRHIVSEGLINFSPVVESYRNVLNRVIRTTLTRVLTYVFTGLFLILSIGFVVTGLIKNEFFPATDQENIYINIEGPAGWNSNKTDVILREVESRIVDTPELISLITQSGRTLSDNGGGANGPHTGYLAVTLSDTEDRDRTSIEIAQAFRDELAEIKGADITVVEQSGGPPAGADFQVNIKGDDLETLETISQDFIAIVDEIEGTVNVESTLKQSAGEIQIKLDGQAVAQRNLSAAQIGGFIRTALSGSQVSSINVNNLDQDITVTFDDKQTPITQIQNLVIPGPTGSYALSEVAELTLETSPQSIVREDQLRVVRVLAATSEGASSTEILEMFQEKVKDYQMPEGYTWDVGGANEENQRSINSIIQAMGVSVILILITMVLQLESFRKSALVLTVIPLAVAGVFFNFTLLGIPLSFPALIGVLALFGIVVNNSIMLVEKINQNRSFGFELKEAITDACSSRLEPILLTSLTTSAGLLPITISDPLWRGLGGAIIAGLSVSGVLILILLPVLYYEVYKGEEKA